MLGILFADLKPVRQFSYLEVRALISLSVFIKHARFENLWNEALYILWRGFLTS